MFDEAANWKGGSVSITPAEAGHQETVVTGAPSMKAEMARTGLSGILCAGPVDIYWPMKRSPKMTANWTRASFHSRGARFQSAAA